jgi:TonB-linked SusC/RagA family outer membrane protein
LAFPVGSIANQQYIANYQALNICAIYKYNQLYFLQVKIYATFFINKLIMEKLKLTKCWKTMLLLISMSLISGTIFAQSITIRGKVVDSKGEVLIGATVKVKAAPATATTTNISGDFVLRVPANTTTITISYIGYVSLDLAIKPTSSNLGQIPLANDANSLSEVVVVGYGVQNKRDITGSVTTVDEATLKEVPATNVTSQLEGKVAGLDILSGGSTLGATPSIHLRGSRSIGQTAYSGADQALIVVDGVVYSGSINDINPQDIRDVEILKDASATAIYGSRGSSGVILITTNRGRVGQSITTLNSYYGVSNMANDVKVLNASQYAQLKLDGVLGQILDPISAGAVPAIGQTYGLSGAETTGLANGTNTDWQKLLYQGAYVADQTLGISGGNEATQFNVSAGYRVETAVEPGVRRERYNLQTQLDHQISKSIKVGVNTTNTLTYSNNPGNNEVNALQISPLLSPFNTDGSLNAVPWAGLTDSSYPNPLYTKYNMAAFYNNTRSFHSFTNLYTEWKIIKGLTYRFTVGYDFQQNQNATYNGVNSTGITAQSQTTAGINNSSSYKYTLDNLLTYDRTIGEKHHINFTALFSNEKSHSDGAIANVNNVPADVNQAYYLQGSTPTTEYSSWSEYGLVSEMARLSYSYDGRLALTATVRNDASSELSIGHQYLAYPAIGAAWNINEEKWMKQYEWVDNLKLRASYGITSNGPNGGLGPYQTLGQLSGGNPYSYGSVAAGNSQGLLVGGLANYSLTWQKTAEWNLGVDFGILKNRISGTVDVYTQKTTGIILSNALPASNGATSQASNLGTSANKGLEISISSINIQNKGGFSWTTDFNIAFSREHIVSLPNGIQANIGSGEFVGWPLNVIYDTQKVGIWQMGDATQHPAVDSKGNPLINPQTNQPYMVSSPVTAQTSPLQYPGQIRVKDVNGDGKITPADNVIVGTYQPQYTGGITNRFTYKGFDLSVVIAARMGFTTTDPYVSTGGSIGGWAFLGTGRHNQPYVNYWTPTNPGGTFPVPNQLQQSVAFASSLQYYDGSWIKARSINLGYTIPSKLLTRIGISSVRVYANCTNPFVIYAPIRKIADGVDPESQPYNINNLPTVGVGNSGSDPRPQGLALQEYTRQFIFGLNLRF